MHPFATKVRSEALSLIIDSVHLVAKAQPSRIDLKYDALMPRLPRCVVLAEEVSFSLLPSATATAWLSA
jgi:hypothetical protein